MNVNSRVKAYVDQLEEANTALRLELDSKQAQIDLLMLEYCPEDMTPVQIETWKNHQVRSYLHCDRACMHTGRCSGNCKVNLT